MWQRKSFVELEKEKEDFNESVSKNSFLKAVKRFIYAFFGVLSFAILKALITGPESDIDMPAPSNPIKINELPEYLDTFLIISVIIAMIVFIVSLLAPKYFIHNYKTTLICSKCFKVKNPDNEVNCDCGGFFENLDLYKWIPDDGLIDLNQNNN